MFPTLGTSRDQEDKSRDIHALVPRKRKYVHLHVITESSVPRDPGKDPPAHDLTHDLGTPRDSGKDPPPHVISHMFGPTQEHHVTLRSIM